MDVNNQHLKTLLERTDTAFRELLKEPDSYDLNIAYEKAKEELDSYIVSLRQTLAQRALQR
ncbi:hypothetical protein CA267_004685 [Alteromonas pelagimontana]|uniref:Uncharacterized protein n=1 Tax=Alteromonas pelagimontana TaxID=1858656 RepID=A0A6M4MAD6_9ALTE|nr:hypothetical protein [Alteromonas pelagimontana]QJR80123.1 hypothetical protein CA267_004685 [Alteromonas pelagimontana]